jgi:phospholipid-binding lipoprotein MlaA
LRTCLKLLGILSVALGLTACTTVSSPSPADPLEGFNRSMFGFNETVDQAALRPLAKGYQTVTPPEVRTCIGNFFSNLGDIAVAVNNLLQGKPKAAGSDLCRVALNSTLGILGFVDVASELGFQKNNEDFGQTLGVWGVSPGPYLVLPFFGPSSFRDATGSLVDSPLAPVRHVNDIRTRNTLFVVQAVDKRERLLSVTDLADRVALDKYAFMRDGYLARRESLIRDGAPDPTEPSGSEEEEEDQGAWLLMDPPAVGRLAHAEVGKSPSVMLSLPGQIQASDRALHALGLRN